MFNLTRQLGIGAGLWLWSDLKTILTSSVRMGFSGVELSATRSIEHLGGSGFWPWETEQKEILAPLLKEFAWTGLHQSGMGDIAPLSSNPRIKEESFYQLEATMDCALALGCSYVVTHPGANSCLYQPEPLEKIILENYERLTKLAEKKRLKITVENAEILEELPLSKLLGLVRKINSEYLGITLDVGHAFVPRDNILPYHEFGSLSAFIKEAGNRIYNVHLHDYDGEKDHRIIGKGRINYGPVIQAFREIDYENPLIIEIIGDKADDFADSRTALERAMGS